LTFQRERAPLAVPVGRPGRILSEEAFRWILANERARAGHSKRPLRLLLVSLQLGPRQAVRIEPTVAARLFAALRGAARETDVIGWYREDRVAGVVLAQCGNRQEPETCAGILQRVSGSLHECLPSMITSQLRLQALRVRPTQRNDGPVKAPSLRNRELNA
jgi:hypothetical protein